MPGPRLGKPRPLARVQVRLVLGSATPTIGLLRDCKDYYIKIKELLQID